MSNAADKNNMTHTSEDVQRKMNSIYGSLQMNWDGWLFMDITARNDWSSTMSKENQSYFYPSVSLSGVISDMVEKVGGTMPAVIFSQSLRNRSDRWKSSLQWQKNT